MDNIRKIRRTRQQMAKDQYEEWLIKRSIERGDGLPMGKFEKRIWIVGLVVGVVALAFAIGGK